MNFEHQQLKVELQFYETSTTDKSFPLNLRNISVNFSMVKKTRIPVVSVLGE